ncbi:hypothetical protein [Nesterenkonia natronophila]|uniref:Uncharacterized protein n=1 Tax=Nesterenkonia natronophila TaxID=2174932 RepID=A0A3A4EYZ9_9MICC|nr:hypothetical protein [Nesterenkonia natronophila]RJN31102.1 hypothetical protein D3250_09545 [Nesterenkonia natronophila]
MLLLATTLIIIGLGDILRSLLRGGAFLTLAGLVGVSALVILGTGALTGLPWWAVGLSVLPALLWFWTVSVQPDAPTRSVRETAPKVLGFVLISGVITVMGDTEAIAGEALRVPTVGRFDTELAVLAAGLTLFHVVSANALVRLALSAEQHGRSAPESEMLVRKPQLKGGRWIGPLERITLTGLLVAGAYPVVAGLIAAKGIVRFPEMQEDRAEGNKAEYFLVGSFVSWTIAIIAAGLLWSVI